MGYTPAFIAIGLFTAYVSKTDMPGRVHQSVRANFLMSPLAVAFALAGRVNIDTANEPLGRHA